MTPNDEPIPPEARKAIRLAIATHLTNALITRHWDDRNDVELVDTAYSLADLLIGKAGL